MPLKIGFLIEQFRNWFPEAQAKFKAQAAEIEAKVRQRNLTPLPPSQITTLSNQIDRLAIPDCYLTTVKSKLSEAIAQWQQQQDAPNSLVVLGSPVEPVGKIVNEVLANWHNQDIVSLKSVSWSHRPPNYSSIKSQLSQEIDRVEDVTGDANKHQVMIIIPDLSWCFLRCVDGLDAIEYIQDLLFQDRSRFWLIGCNSWAWKYLNVVCQLGGYLEQTLSLPDLKDIELKEWLTPVAETIPLDFDNDHNSLHDNLNSDTDNQEDWVSSSQQNYFKHLAEISLGSTSVAARLWLLSLGIEKQEDQPDSAEASESENQSSSTVILAKAILPDLPELTKDDHYLLFSLCLHGQMTLSELALSLGERQPKIQNQVQALWRSGILERSQDLLKVNPAHYPQLKKDLSNNHFLID